MVQRHHTALAVWFVAFAALVLWAGAAMVDSALEDRVASSDRAQAAKIEHFFLVLAEQRSGLEPGPANKLARDLRTVDSRDVYGFRGDANRYGGITGELGFDPFDGSNCDECGELNFAFSRQIVRVKGGEVDAVIAEIEASIEKQDPFGGPPPALWLLWLGSLPVYMLVHTFVTKRGEEKRYVEVAAERHLLNEIHDTLRELPPGDERAIGLSSVAQRLEAQINQRVAYRKTKKEDMKLEALATEATAALESIEAGNRELT